MFYYLKRSNGALVGYVKFLPVASAGYLAPFYGDDGGKNMAYSDEQHDDNVSLPDSEDRDIQ